MLSRFCLHSTIFYSNQVSQLGEAVHVNAQDSQSGIKILPVVRFAIIAKYTCTLSC